MRIFKKIAAFLLALIVMESLFVFLLEPVTFDYFLSHDKREAKEAGEAVDLVFFGDSRTIRSFYPDIFEGKIEGVDLAFNEGVNQQNIESTYYFMKDYLEHNKLTYAVVNLNYDYFLNTTQDAEMAKGLTLDRMESLPGALEFIFNCYSLEEYPEILRSYRYRYEVDNIPRTIDTKLSKEYREGIDIRDDIHHVSKGYATWDLAYKQGNVGTPAGCYVWSEETIDYKALGYIDKIVALCKEYGVNLYFVESPVTISRMYAIEGYADFEETVGKKCDELGVPFWNLNLLKEESVSMYDPYFTDTEHLNDVGSARISEMLAAILSDHMDGKDVSEAFYPDFDALNADWACVGSCDLAVWDVDTDAEQIPWEELENSAFSVADNAVAEEADATGLAGCLVLYGTAFAAENIVTEYCFSVTYDGGETYTVLKDYGTENSIVLDKADLSENAEFRIDARPQNAEDIHHSYRTTLD